MIYYGKQSIDQDDIDEVVKVLRSDLITQGPISTKFEEAISEYTGAKYSVACSHGTAALHLACLALGVGGGDIVWTTPNTFVASANCALYCGATVDFVDIDEHTLNISILALKEKLGRAAQKNVLPKAVIVVHFGGNSCDLSEIKALSEQFGFSIIEDACHALGGTYKNQKIGSCRFSDIAVFSFHPVKSITAGEGGVLVTNQKPLALKAKLLANHGITRDVSRMESIPDGPWYYEQVELGFNYRITDIQSALGLSQLKKLDDFIKKRQAIAQFYTDAFSSLPITVQKLSVDAVSAYHLYTVTLQGGDNRLKNEMADYLKDNEIIVNCHYIPVHLQPYYKKMGFREGDFPVSEKYYDCSFSLPIYPSLTFNEQEKVISAVSDFLTK